MAETKLAFCHERIPIVGSTAEAGRETRALQDEGDHYSRMHRDCRLNLAVPLGNVIAAKRNPWPGVPSGRGG
jgi:hypothetical protein